MLTDNYIHFLYLHISCKFEAVQHAVKWVYFGFGDGVSMDYGLSQ